MRRRLRWLPLAAASVAPPSAFPAVPSRASGAACPYAVRVYSYEFSPSYAFNELAAAARRSPARTHFEGEHLLAQFTLEFVLADFFSQACVRTDDPERADFYFVPFYSDIEYRSTGRPDAPSRHGAALLDILERNDTSAWVREFGVTDEYWRRHPERHLLVQAAPVTGWRHPKGRRGWAHYAVQLAAPVFLSVEVSRSFALEYPSCARKNVVLPYPIPGRAWHDSGPGSWPALGAALRGERFDAAARTGDPDRPRPLLAAYSGGRHGCVNVRDGIAGALRGDAAVAAAAARVAAAWRDARGPGAGAAPRQAVMHAAVFCPCPEGDSPSAKRQYDAVLAGCVPVVASDDALYAFDDALLGGPLSERDFALRVPEAAAVDGSFLAALRAAARAGRDRRPPKGRLRRTRASSLRGRRGDGARPLVASSTRGGGARAGAAARRGRRRRVEASGPAQAVNATALAALRRNGAAAAHWFRYYAPGRVPRDPLPARAYPDGGAPALLVAELDARARERGSRAAACAAERAAPHYDLAKQFCGPPNREKEIFRLGGAARAGGARARAAKAGIAAFKAGRIAR